MTSRKFHAKFRLTSSNAFRIPNLQEITKMKKQMLLRGILVLLFLTGAVQAQVSQSDRLEIFNKVRKTINEKYYDPHFNGVDWSRMRDLYSPRIQLAKNDQEFYTLVKQMVGELSD